MVHELRPLSERIREAVKAYRKARRLTQIDVAKMCGISREGYLRFENGTSKSQLDYIDRIEQGLGIRFGLTLIPVGIEDTEPEVLQTVVEEVSTQLNTVPSPEVLEKDNTA